MRDRRSFVISLTGMLAAMTPACWASQATPATKPASDAPKAVVIPGKPPLLAFEDGVRVPCSKDAFLTLWEGKTYWMTFGAGRSHYSQQAQGQAVKYASAAMKLLLMTLALAPDRLEPVMGGGWRLKSRNIGDFVRGDVILPGAPFWPTTAADMGFGDADAPALGSLGFAAPSGGAPTSGGVEASDSWNEVNAFAAYVVRKSDASLDYVRARTQLVR